MKNLKGTTSIETKINKIITFLKYNNYQVEGYKLCKHELPITKILVLKILIKALTIAEYEWVRGMADVGS